MDPDTAALAAALKGLPKDKVAQALAAAGLASHPGLGTGGTMPAPDEVAAPPSALAAAAAPAATAASTPAVPAMRFGGPTGVSPAPQPAAPSALATEASHTAVDNAPALPPAANKAAVSPHRPDAATADLHDIVAHDADPEEAALEAKDAGNNAFRRGDMDSALRHYTRAIELDASNHVFYLNRAAVHLKQGSHAEARSDASEAVGRKPSAKAFLRRAMAQSHLGNDASAIDDLARALSYEPSSKAVLAAAAEALGRRKAQLAAETASASDATPDARTDAAVAQRALRVREWLSFVGVTWSAPRVTGNPAPPALSGHSLTPLPVWGAGEAPDGGGGAASADVAAAATRPVSPCLLYGGRGVRSELSDVYSLDVLGRSWSDVAVRGNPPPHRSWHTATVVGGWVVVFGGVSNRGELGDVHVLDTSHRVWCDVETTAVKKLPARRSGHSACATDKHVFVFGGRYKRELLHDLWRLTVHASLEAADASGGATDAPDATAATASHGDGAGESGSASGAGAATAVALELGTGGTAGRSASGPGPKVTCKWKRLKHKGAGEPPPPRDGHTANLVHRARTRPSIVVFGGNVGDAGSAKANDVWAFDLSEETWTLVRTRGAPPQARSHHTTVAMTLTGAVSTDPELLFVYGGRGEDAELSDLHVLDTAAMSWSTPKTTGIPPPGRAWHAACALGRTMIVYGGGGGVRPLDDVVVLDATRTSLSSPDDAETV